MLRPSCFYRPCKPHTRAHCCIPVNASVSDAHSLLEVFTAELGQRLSAGVEVGFNHHTNDALLPGNDLLCDGSGDDRLVVVVLARVP